MVTSTLSDGFAAFAAAETDEQEARWRAQHHAPDDEARAALEGRTRQRWEDRRELLEAKERRRIYELAQRFPARAFAAAQTPNVGASAIAQLKGWDAIGIAVLAGPPGTGKTTAATWWALQQRTAPEFMRATELAASGRFDKDVRARWSAARALGLDDLGAEYSDAKGSFRVDLDELVDVFYAAVRPFVITTNLTRVDFRARYGERVVDRLREVGTWSTGVGPSMRGQR